MQSNTAKANYLHHMAYQDMPIIEYFALQSICSYSIHTSLGENISSNTVKCSDVAGLSAGMSSLHARR